MHAQGRHMGMRGRRCPAPPVAELRGRTNLMQWRRGAPARPAALRHPRLAPESRHTLARTRAPCLVTRRVEL
eukprot:5845044-Alexandrium_andersonii.AAC.1